MKKVIFILLIVIFLLPNYVMADSNMLARIGDKYFNSFLEAYNAASDGDTITLLEDVILNETLLINKNITINLNENNIESDNSVLKINGGHLKITGKGIIREKQPNLYAVLLQGSRDSKDTDYSSVIVGEDVTLEGWAGIFIDRLQNDGDIAGGSSYNSSYGVKATIYGKLIGKEDNSGGAGIGVYINGNVKASNNYPVIDIKDGAIVESDGVGIYMAGYAKVNIGKAKITGVESGIATKAGILNSNGSNVIGTGKEKTPSAYGNGINPTGAALQIESNAGYAGNIEIIINEGRFESKNTSAIVEYLDSKVSDTSVINMSIKNSEFITYNGKEKITASSSFKDKYGSIVNEIETFNEKDVVQNIVINNNITKRLIITVIVVGVIAVFYIFIKKYVIF